MARKVDHAVGACGGAQSCFEYSLSKEWDLFLSTKNTIRTSPAQALLTILARHLPDAQRLTCSRSATVVCPVCTSGAMRAERGWVTAVGDASQ